MAKQVKYFSMFSGVGCFEYSFPKEWECVGFSEINPVSIAIYKYHFPNHKNYGNAKKIKAKELPDFDILCAGFPCQAFSVSGLRKGFNDTRGTLFFDIARIAKEKRPKYLLLENVEGLLSHDTGRTFKIILSTLTEMGYNIQTMVLNSKYHSIPQNRSRVFIVGHLGERSIGKILPVRANAKDTFGKCEPEVNTITARYFEGGGTGSYVVKGEYEAQGISIADYRYDEGLRIRDDLNSPTLLVRSGERVSNIPLIIYNMMPRSGDPKKGGTGRLINTKGIAYTIDTRLVSNAIQISDFRIRRFTEVEAERLQGLPDNWTKWGDFDNGTMDMFGDNKRIQEIKDTDRMECIGNGLTTNVAKFTIENFI